MWAVVLLLLLQLAPTVNQKADAERLFNLGVQLYNDGDAAGAVAAFQGAEVTGWTSGMLQYDLGTAHLSLRKYGPAILHFERARKLMPGNEAVLHNLRVALERAGVSDDTTSPFAIASNRLSFLGGPTFWLGIGFVLYLGLIALVAFRFWKRADSAWSRRAITLLAPVTICAFAVALSVWGDVRTPAAIVVSEDAQLRRSPSPDASSRATVPPGQRVRITDSREGWQSVRLPGGVRGWLPERSVERI